MSKDDILNSESIGVWTKAAAKSAVKTEWVKAKA